MRRIILVSLCAGVASLAACGLEIGGTLGGADADLADGGAGDGPAQLDGALDTAAMDVTSVPDAVDEPGPPLPCTTPPGACVGAVPGGWTLVAYETSRAKGCPANFTQQDVVGGPQAQAGACDCGCNVTKQPVCDVGSIPFKVTGANCGSAGVTANVNGPNCTNLGAATIADHVQGAPIPPSGGTCTAPTITDPNKVTVTPARQCVAPNECKEDVCNGVVPSGFSACISRSGAQTCPLGWNANQPIVIGTGVDLACTGCTCQVNQTSTCTGATMALFNNNNCSGNPVSTLTVDGNCNVPASVGSSVDHFKYQATLNTVCQATGAKTPTTLDVTGKLTVCCK